MVQILHDPAYLRRMQIEFDCPPKMMQMRRVDLKTVLLKPSQLLGEALLHVLGNRSEHGGIVPKGVQGSETRRAGRTTQEKVQLADLI